MPNLFGVNIKIYAMMVFLAFLLILVYINQNLNTKLAVCRVRTSELQATLDNLKLIGDQQAAQLQRQEKEIAIKQAQVTKEIDAIYADETLSSDDCSVVIKKGIERAIKTRV